MTEQEIYDRLLNEVKLRLKKFYAMEVDAIISRNMDVIIVSAEVFPKRLEGYGYTVEEAIIDFVIAMTARRYCSTF